MPFQLWPFVRVNISSGTIEYTYPKLQTISRGDSRQAICEVTISISMFFSFVFTSAQLSDPYNSQSNFNQKQDAEAAANVKDYSPLPVSYEWPLQQAPSLPCVFGNLVSTYKQEILTNK